MTRKSLFRQMTSCQLKSKYWWIHQDGAWCLWEKEEETRTSCRTTSTTGSRAWGWREARAGSRRDLQAPAKCLCFILSSWKITRGLKQGMAWLTSVFKGTVWLLYGEEWRRQGWKPRERQGGYCRAQAEWDGGLGGSSSWIMRVQKFELHTDGIWAMWDRRY